ncbi:MAG: shikimate kinase [Rickettsiales bacterium]|jgi:shikimate kinase|nr:shikimate kinase [Rickettsiales bacterium]
MAQDAKITLIKPVVLVGLMGAGKTTIGRRLAQALAVPFIDSDQEIVEAAGCSISDIFALYGESIFRDLEQRVLVRLIGASPCILATGGGAFINPMVRQAIKDHAISVWLKADLETLVERTSRRDTRPLLKTGDKSEILAKLMDERYPIYAEADITIDSNASAHEAVVDRIMQALKERHHG